MFYKETQSTRSKEYIFNFISASKLIFIKNLQKKTVEQSKI